MIDGSSWHVLVGPHFVHARSTIESYIQALPGTEVGQSFLTIYCSDPGYERMRSTNEPALWLGTVAHGKVKCHVLFRIAGDGPLFLLCSRTSSVRVSFPLTAPCHDDSWALNRKLWSVALLTHSIVG
jgi:hypothetical protein